MQSSQFKIVFSALAITFTLLACSNSQTKALDATRSDLDQNYRGSWAQVPVILARIQVPSFQDFTIDVTEAPYNAVANGQTDARQSIQRAIIDVSRYGGGMVRIPAGQYLVDGPLHLESNINLHLEEGAEITFGTNYDKYLPQVLARYEGTDIYGFSPLIYAYQKRNIAITGKGKFNGQAETSWSTFVPKAADEQLTRIAGSSKGKSELETRIMNNKNTPIFERQFDSSSRLRTDFVLFYDSENILIEGVHFIDSPFWVNHFYMSNNITVRNMSITSLNKNNDGIDIESSHDVHIHDVVFDTGDDCISIKSGRDLEGLRKMIPSKNVVIQNVRFLADDALALGSEASGGVRNVFLENAEASNLRKGFYFKANRNRGSQFEHIRIRNMTIGDLADVPENRRKLNMIEVTTNYDSSGVEFNRQPVFKDIRFENITAGTSIYPLKLEGTDQSLLRDFVIDNVHLGPGEQPNAVSDVDWETMYFRDFSVAGKPVTAHIGGAESASIVPQVSNTPPDVYAGEEEILSLSAGNSIVFHGDAIDAEGDSLTYRWVAVPSDSESVSRGEDDAGKSINFEFGDDSNVSIQSPSELTTEISFSASGTYRIRLNVSDGEATGYHTVYIEVRP